MIETSSMKQGYTRIPKGDIPKYPVLCPMITCVYNKESVCDDPSCNKGNSDASCHKVGIRRLLLSLIRIENE